MEGMDELLEHLRPKGFAIAYRMLGSVGEAEDVVQEALLRLYRELEDGVEIDAPEAFFTTVVTRLAIDELRSVRARRRVGSREPRFETSREQRERLAGRFFDAFEEGDLEGLESLLAADVALHGDGGGKVPALARPLHGRSRVARTMLGFRRTGKRFGGFTLHRVELNGEPGALTFGPYGKLINVLSLEIAGGQVQSVSSLVNPDKLSHLGPVGDLKALIAAAGKRNRHS